MTSREQVAAVADLNQAVARQRVAFETKFADPDVDQWAFHDTHDPLTRYLRDRRLTIAVDHLLAATRTNAGAWRGLVVCGGVGGEGTYLANRGFAEVTVGDFSESALCVCRRRDKRLRTRVLNAEDLPYDDSTFDLVLVQDGLHHLSRPTLGLTEMLRVARRGVIVIEPHLGVVARLFGTVWEHEGDAINYVFRWNRNLVEQTVRSYLLRADCRIEAIRLWDHNVMMRKLVSVVPFARARPRLARFGYRVLDTLAARMGNMMIAVVIKGTEADRAVESTLCEPR